MFSTLRFRSFSSIAVLVSLVTYLFAWVRAVTSSLVSFSRNGSTSQLEPFVFIAFSGILLSMLMVELDSDVERV